MKSGNLNILLHEEFSEISVEKSENQGKNHDFKHPSILHIQHKLSM